MFTEDDIRNICYTHIDISKISEVFIGYSEGVWVLVGKAEDKTYVLADGKTNDTNEGHMSFGRIDR